jgi:thioredoxin reductase (NADPH)
MLDTVIIGSGPAGLSAAVYACREALDFVVVEKEFMGTGQIALSERVDNYLGLYGESGFDIGEKFRTHAESLGAKFLEGNVNSVENVDGFYRIYLENGETIETKTLIAATGAYPKKLDITGEKEFAGKGVSYCGTCDGAFYSGKTVAVIGGGDTALQDALLLSKIADKVYLVHRRNEFRGNKILVDKVKQQKNIQLILDAKPVEIIGTKTVEGLTVEQKGCKKSLEVNGVFAAVGTVPNSTLFKDLLNLDSNGYVIADENGITSADGVFAAGDLRTKSLRQVVTAVADGANCVVSVQNYILKRDLL